MERSSSVTPRIAPAHRISASATNPFEKPSPGARVAPLDADGNNLAWSTPRYSLSAPASTGLVGSDAGAITPAMAGSLNREPSTIDAQTSNKPRKPRRPKPRIELASDQPPTTQGKARARVYVACLQWYFYTYCVPCFQLIRVVAAIVKFVAMAQNPSVIIVVDARTRNVNMTLFRKGEDRTRPLERVNVSSENCKTSWMCSPNPPNDGEHKKSETRMVLKTHLVALRSRTSNHR